MPTDLFSPFLYGQANAFTHNGIHGNYNNVRFPDEAINRSAQPTWGAASLKTPAAAPSTRLALSLAGLRNPTVVAAQGSQPVNLKDIGRTAARPTCEKLWIPQR